MFASRTRRTVICAIVCALLASAFTAVAPVSANERTQAAGALAQERYYSSYSTPHTIGAGNPAGAAAQDLRSADTRDAAQVESPPPTPAAQAQERYYSSYGEPEPPTAAQSPQPSDDTPWLPIALSITAGLVLVAASATQLRRLRLRRHRATRSAA